MFRRPSDKDYKLLARSYVESALRSFEGRRFFLFDYGGKTYGGLVLDLRSSGESILCDIIKIRAPIPNRLVEAIVENRKDVHRVRVDESILFEKGVELYASLSGNTLRPITLEEYSFLMSRNGS